jgi:hypothetical protein
VTAVMPPGLKSEINRPAPSSTVVTVLSSSASSSAVGSRMRCLRQDTNSNLIISFDLIPLLPVAEIYMVRTLFNAPVTRIHLHHLQAGVQNEGWQPMLSNFHFRKLRKFIYPLCRMCKQKRRHHLRSTPAIRTAKPSAIIDAISHYFD